MAPTDPLRNPSGSMVEFCTPRVSAWQCSAGRRRGDMFGTARRRHTPMKPPLPQLYCASVSVATARPPVVQPAVEGPSVPSAQ